MCRVLIIVVNFKAADATTRFVESSQRLDSCESSRVLVVENGSGDGSVEKLRSVVSKFRNVDLLESNINRGYFGGANWALKQFTSCHARAEWVIVCNNDIIFNDSSFIDKLLKRNPNDVGVIAPAIIARLTEVDCNPFHAKRPSAWAMLRCRVWHSNYYFMWFKQLLSPNVRKLRRRWGAPEIRCEPNSCAQIYAPHGSFLIFSRNYFDSGGYLDDGVFLYGEELCTAEICRRLGLKIVHDPGLKVWHEGHRATGRLLDRRMYQHARRSLNYVTQKHFSSSDSKASRRHFEGEETAGMRN